MIQCCTDARYRINACVTSSNVVTNTFGHSQQMCLVEVNELTHSHRISCYTLHLSATVPVYPLLQDDLTCGSHPFPPCCSTIQPLSFSQKPRGAGGRGASGTYSKPPSAVPKIREALNFMRNHSFEVPFIANYRKEYVEPELDVHDLWTIWQSDEKVYCI